MKRLIIVTTIALLAMAASCYALPADQTLASTVNATVGGVFSLEFYNDANVIYSTSIPFSSVDPISAYNYADGRVENDGKSDTGVIATSNYGNTWYLKLNINPTSGLAGAFGCYISQPTNRNTSSAADGALTYVPPAWFTVLTTAETIYTAGPTDKNNTPFGTLATFNFKIDGTGLVPGIYSGTITYTLSETL